MAISERSETIIKEFLVEWWRALSWQAQETLLGTQLPNATAQDLYDSAFGNVLRQMSAAAEGLSERNEMNVGEVAECVQQVCEWLFARPTMPTSYEIPESFWMTPLGDLAIRAHIWCHNDRLISMSEAAESSGKSLSALSQLADRGRLHIYPDPNEPNPTKRNRVRASEVQKLKPTRAKK